MGNGPVLYLRHQHPDLSVSQIAAPTWRAQRNQPRLAIGLPSPMPQVYRLPRYPQPASYLRLRHLLLKKFHRRQALNLPTFPFLRRQPLTRLHTYGIPLPDKLSNQKKEISKYDETSLHREDKPHRSGIKQTLGRPHHY